MEVLPLIGTCLVPERTAEEFSSWWLLEDVWRMAGGECRVGDVPIRVVIFPSMYFWKNIDPFSVRWMPSCTLNSGIRWFLPFAKESLVKYDIM